MRGVVVLVLVPVLRLQVVRQMVCVRVMALVARMVGRRRQRDVVVRDGEHVRRRNSRHWELWRVRHSILPCALHLTVTVDPPPPPLLPYCLYEPPKMDYRGIILCNPQWAPIYPLDRILAPPTAPSSHIKRLLPTTPQRPP